MRYLEYFVVSAFVFLSFSCGHIILPPLEVVSCKFNDNGVELEFSKPPKQSSFRSAFSLTEDENVVSGNIVFSKTKVSFIPEKGIRKDMDYRIVILSELEDEYGRSMLEDFVLKHTTKTDSQHPEISSVFPKNGQVVEVENHIDFPGIKINFSEPVDKYSFDDSFSVSPSFDFFASFNEAEDVVDIVPTSPLSLGTRYVVKVSTNLKDKSRNNMQKEFTMSFEYGCDTTAPSHKVSVVSKEDVLGYKDLLDDAVLGNGEKKVRLNKNNVLKIDWDEEIAMESVKNFLLVEPEVPFEVTVDERTRKSITMEFDCKDIWGKGCTLRILKGITDVFGNKTREDDCYNLVFEDESDRPVSFVGALVRNGEGYDLLEPENPFSSLVFDVVEFPATTGDNTVQTEMLLLFTVSQHAEGVDRFSAMENIELSSTNNCCDLVIKAMAIVKTQADEDVCRLVEANFPNPSLFDGKVCLIRCLVDVRNKERQGIVTLVIKQGLHDDLGNFMVADVVCKVNKA